jgi:hypothetical protein
MNTIYFDAQADDNCRRKELYNGQLFVYSPCPSAKKLCEFARNMIESAFGSVNPRKTQDKIPVEQCASILAELKPHFIHHPTSKELLRGILVELGCDLTKTYFDVPRMRSAFPSDYLTSGIAYAFHPHRDTWYSAPFCQLNWWMPIYPITSENCMALHPHYWSRPVRNSSSSYNYYLWNEQSRKNAAQYIKSDTRIQPRPEEPLELDPQVRLVCDVGGIFIFSAAHLHSTVPNTSGLARYSIDFRTVHLDDVWNRSGAVNVDSACTGTTMRDYLRGSDLSGLPAEAIALYDDGTEITGDLVYGHPATAQP